MTLETPSLLLMAQTKEQVLASVEQMSVEDRRQVSPEWLTLVESSSSLDPWIHGFVMLRRSDATRVGQCGFTGPPGPDGGVELAYGVDPKFQGQGYATEAAQGLTSFAGTDPRVRIVRAHTLPQENASTRVLTKCGFLRVGEGIDHEVGTVWKWERGVDGCDFQSRSAYPRPESPG